MAWKQAGITCRLHEYAFWQCDMDHSKVVKDLWVAFLHCWSTVYIGHLNRIRSDREFGVNSALFHDFATTNGI